MTVDSSKSKILELIAKLQEVRFDRGATPAEAELAAMHVQRLLAEHQLSIFDVESRKLREEVCEEERRVPQKGRQKWVMALADCLAQSHSCRWFSWRRARGQQAGESVTFIGIESDARTCAYLFEVLGRTLIDLSDRDAKRHLRSGGAQLVRWRNSYITAAALAIRKRLRDQGSVDHCPDDHARHTALIQVKGEAVQGYMQAHYPKVGALSRSSSQEDLTALQLGYRAGNTVPIQRGLEQAPEAVMALPK